MPDVLVYFSVNLVPLQGGLTVANVAGLRPFLTSSAASFAALISVPPAQVYAVNVSDIATGASTQVGSIRRQLAGAGSLGVAVTYVVRLGKTPRESDVVNISAVLASPTLAASTLRAVAAQLGAATTLGAAAFAVSVPPASVTLANAPFTVGGETVVVASAASAAGAGSVGAAAGGAAGGIAAIFLAVWIWRSYSKHKTLPCCRDRRSELLSKNEVSRAIAEAEAVLDANAGAASPGVAAAKPKGPKPGAQSALIVRKLAQESAAAKAEVLALRKQIAAAKSGEAPADADEMKELRRQLAAARAQASAQATQPAPGGDAPAATLNPIVVSFAPRPVE